MRARNLTVELERAGPFDPHAMGPAEARRRLQVAYAALGFKRLPRLLTLPERQHKLGLSKRRSVGLTLAPADMSGDYDVCSWRTAACTAACVIATAGKGIFPNVRRGRVAKTKVLGREPQAFLTRLVGELEAQVARHGPLDFRPNVGSDLRWELICPALFTLDGVRVYDYTKAPRRARAQGQAYDRLVFSVSEARRSQGEALDWLRAGGNVAVVFDTKRGHDLPATFAGFPVLDGDQADSRADDPAGAVVGLRAKGAARRVVGSAGGFVRPGVDT